jgi:hypothetical protein
VFGVGKVLKGEDGVGFGQGRVRVFMEWERDRYIFVEGEHFINGSSGDVEENKDFVTSTDIERVDLEEVLGFVRDKFNIEVAGRILGSRKDNLKLTFGKERNSKALVLELLQGVKEGGDVVVHGSDVNN